MDNNIKVAATSPWHVLDLTLRFMQRDHAQLNSYFGYRSWVITELATVKQRLESFPYAPYNPDQDHEKRTKDHLEYLQNHQDHH